MWSYARDMPPTPNQEHAITCNKMWSLQCRSIVTITTGFSSTAGAVNMDVWSMFISVHLIYDIYAALLAKVISRHNIISCQKQKRCPRLTNFHSTTVISEYLSQQCLYITFQTLCILLLKWMKRPVDSFKILWAFSKGSGCFSCTLAIKAWPPCSWWWLIGFRSSNNQYAKGSQQL